MATITKTWANGDVLSLVTSEGNIAVSSVQNLTGADRQMTIQVQTTNSGTKVTKDIIIKQLKYAAQQDGYWVHKTTGAKTYFGVDADFITNGVMSRPSWIADAKEIKLCSGITDLETSYDESGHQLCSVFHIDTINSTNLIIEVIDFSLTTISTLYPSLLVSYSYDGSTFQSGVLNKIILPSTVTSIGIQAIMVYEVFPNDVSIENIPSSLTNIGGEVEYDGIPYQLAGIVNGFTDSGKAKFILKTATSNVSALQSLITSENTAGQGITGDYQIIGV